jgi:hypothetical protein
MADKPGFLSTSKKKVEKCGLFLMNIKFVFSRIFDNKSYFMAKHRTGHLSGHQISVCVIRFIHAFSIAIVHYYD